MDQKEERPALATLNGNDQALHTYWPEAAFLGYALPYDQNEFIMSA